MMHSAYPRTGNGPRCQTPSLGLGMLSIGELRLGMLKFGELSSAVTDNLTY